MFTDIHSLACPKRELRDGKNCTRFDRVAGTLRTREYTSTDHERKKYVFVLNLYQPGTGLIALRLLSEYMLPLLLRLVRTQSTQNPQENTRPNLNQRFQHTKTSTKTSHSGTTVTVNLFSQGSKPRHHHVNKREGKGRGREGGRRDNKQIEQR